jgi:hypothetical protein
VPILFSRVNLVEYLSMGKYVETFTPIVDIVLVDEEGRRLPSPVITAMVDDRTRVVNKLTISTGNHSIGGLDMLGKAK